MRVVLLSFLVDLLNQVIDPRLRESGGASPPVRRKAGSMKAIRSPQAKRRYRSRLNPQLAVGVVLLLIPLVLFVISRFSRYTILEMDPSRRFQGPSAAHWFGTDNYGRDVFVRALSGFLPSVIIAIGTILIGCGRVVAGRLGRLLRRPDRLLDQPL